MIKGKNKKMKITKMYLFLLPPLPSQDKGVVATPSPQLFSRVSGKGVGKLVEWQS